MFSVAFNCNAKMKPETEQNLKFQKKCGKKYFFVTFSFRLNFSVGILGIFQFDFRNKLFLCTINPFITEIEP